MSLNPADLTQKLEEIFSAMEDDEYFADEFSKAVADYAESGTISTTDTGAVSGGNFSGSGTGSIKVDSSICKDILFAATQTMKTMTAGGDALLAAQAAAGVDSMMSAGKVATVVTGTLTPPSPAPPITPYGGAAEGSFSGNSATIQATLVPCFAAMLGMTAGGNAFFAAQAAASITSYLAAGTISTNGKGNIEGSSGNGTGIL